MRKPVPEEALILSFNSKIKKKEREVLGGTSCLPSWIAASW
jgi:hypothetical protein